MKSNISTSIAIIVVLVLIIWGFVAYRSVSMNTTAENNEINSSSTIDTGIDQDTGSSTSSTATSTVYNNIQGGFELSSPNVLTRTDGDMQPTTAWSIQSTSTGLLYVTFTEDKSLQPQTNFGDSKLTIGSSRETDAIKNCTTMPQTMSKDPTWGEKVTINGTTFNRFHFIDAGAGNRYDTTIYRTLHAGQCYSIDFYLHYSVLENYPKSAGITAFDQAKMYNIFDSLVQSFKFY